MERRPFHCFLASVLVRPRLVAARKLRTGFLPVVDGRGAGVACANFGGLTFSDEFFSSELDPSFEGIWGGGMGGGVTPGMDAIGSKEEDVGEKEGERLPFTR